ncbi:Replication factor C subunit 1 [Elsinoe australis]|uniref:Replication factor C subunit 1 n=1 Tax=Elsinoe australis TaxID=40998 RepID=A0A2P7Z3W5_9PEZI|nr:Replication factor C subunit 1 [Elsinoe australis]
MSTDKVFILIRTDYLSRDDEEGHLNLISVHATSRSARKAMNAHIQDHNKVYKLKDPNTNKIESSEDLFGVRVIVGQQDYHSYEAEVIVEQVLDDGGDVVDDAEEEEEVEVKSKAKSNGTKNPAAAAKAKPAPKAKAAPKRKAPSEDEGEDEEAMPGPPSGSANSLSGLSFLITGALEGLKRDEGWALIKKHGGEIISKMPTLDHHPRPDYIVIGVRPGQKKIDEINASGFSTLNQEGLYEMIETRSGGKAGNAKKAKK